jgi:hypothetical protein
MFNNDKNEVIVLQFHDTESRITNFEDNYDLVELVVAFILNSYRKRTANGKIILNDHLNK